jgi:2-C-methyl-D-erythritol 2,4-cyclodiphosphate synthase
MNIRIGNGYDIHQLGADRALILGGVKIPHHLGLVGHSDADVLTHAIMDAILGALSLGDIGHYFPPTDSQWAGADSLVLLERVKQLIGLGNWQYRFCCSSRTSETQTLFITHANSINQSFANSHRAN